MKKIEELCDIGLLPINLPKVELANSLKKRNSKSVFASDLNFVVFVMNFFTKKLLCGERWWVDQTHQNGQRELVFQTTIGLLSTWERFCNIVNLNSWGLTYLIFTYVIKSSKNKHKEEILWKTVQYISLLGQYFFLFDWKAGLKSS